MTRRGVGKRGHLDGGLLLRLIVDFLTQRAMAVLT